MSPRVVLLSPHAQAGGAEQVLLDLVDRLPREAVGAIICLQDGPLVAALRERGTDVVVLPTGGTPREVVAGAWRLRREVRRLAHDGRADVVHANGVKAALMTALADRRIPLVWMKHDVSLDGPAGRLLARRCAAVVGVSDEVLRALRGAGRQVRVPPGIQVPSDAYQQGRALREQLGVTGHVVSVVGRLDPSKGHAELLEVLPALLKAAGDGPLCALLAGPPDRYYPEVPDRLARRAEELGVTGSVRIPGWLPSAAVLAASDVVVVPTVPRPDGGGREGFGLVAAQALVLGVPVVAYDVGATREVVGDAARLVPAGDRGALVKQIAGLLHDDAARAEIAERGRLRAQRYTVDRMLDDLLDVYGQVAR